jgi:hypothetical protein
MMVTCLPLTVMGNEQFSMLKGFEDFYQKYPPRDTVPTSSEEALLKRHAPRFYIALGQEPFLDFYRDYIAHGALKTDAGTLRDVTPEVLNEFRNNPDVVFTHEPSSAPSRQVVYGRVDYDSLRLEDGRDIRLTFLTYNAVFRTSGLPVGIALWQRLLLGLLADTGNWHQLDNYISATIALLPDETPVAVTLQQHNYQRTYILRRDMSLPGDGRIKVDAAISSNELYPHHAEVRQHRCASFLTPAAARWILTAKDRPMLGAVDETHGEREVDYELLFLPQTDAFYTFRGMLGEPRRLPHRDGPPGADFNTIPALKPRAVAMVAFYMRGQDDTQYVELLEQWSDHIFSGPPPEVLRAYRERFLEDLSLDLSDMADLP